MSDADVSEAFKAVEQIYFQTQLKLGVMLAACHTPEEHDKVVAEYMSTRRNYLHCLNQAFHEDDPTLAILVEQAEASAEEIENIEEHLNNIARVIHTLTTAVTYGAAIATKVIAL